MYLEQNGFTLIEIIVVLVIIAVMSSVVVLNVNSSNYATFMSQANKVAATLEAIGDKAVYTNSIVACNIELDGLSCQSYKDGEWDDLNLSKVVNWDWPSKINIEQVMINGVQLKQGDKIRFSPNGNSQPTSIRIGDGQYHTWIDNDLSGNYRISN